MENTESHSSTPRKKRWLRFSMKSLMVLALLVAVWFGSFRFGREAGYDQGNRDGFADGLNAKVITKVYRVSDLLQKEKSIDPGHQGVMYEFDGLISEIIGGIQPTSWEGVGGPATVAPYPQNLSLVISQTERGHDELQEFLDGKRND